ncbi:hypothetical protein O9421_18370, partial [Proteus mirabilis]
TYLLYCERVMMSLLKSLYLREHVFYKVNVYRKK